MCPEWIDRDRAEQIVRGACLSVLSMHQKTTFCRSRVDSLHATEHASVPAAWLRSQIAVSDETHAGKLARARRH
jgi:hypothetical protein